MPGVFIYTRAKDDPTTVFVGPWWNHTDGGNMSNINISQVNGLQSVLDSKASVVHDHSWAQIIDRPSNEELQGPQGPPGAPGSGVHQDLWNWTAPKVPGSGQVTVDAGVLSIHGVSREKIDWGIVLSRLTAGDQIGVQDKMDATVYARWEITGDATLSGDVYQVPVSLRSDVPQGVDPTDGRQVVVAMVKAPSSASFGDVPIFSTLAKAQEWEANNPGKVALTIEEPAPEPDPEPDPLTTPEDIDTLLASWDMGSAVVTDNVITSVTDSVGGRAMTPASVGPSLLVEGDKQFAKFTASSLTRLRWVGAWTDITLPTTICVILRGGGIAGMAVTTSGQEVEVSGSGLAGRSSAAVASVNNTNTDLVLATITYAATGITIRVGTKIDTTTSVPNPIGNNFSLGARAGGTGSSFVDSTIGRVWLYGKEITQAEHDALTVWARSEWGTL